jgi:regulator of ribonuclease activity A
MSEADGGVRTADLYDAHPEVVEVVDPGPCDLRPFGGRRRAHGPIRTVQALADNSKVREALSEPGAGAMLVVDAGAATHFAMVGDRLAALAVDNGWAGIIVNGCVRDAAELAQLPLGVWALGTNPRKTEKRGQGVREVEVQFGGVRFAPGAYLYADEDGVVVTPRAL